MRILAIESSCDETAAAVVEDGRTVRSNVIYSQIETHTLYGGVVPEIASRAHIEKINQVVAQALEQAEMTLREVDAVAVTYGPGLVGPLLIGVSAAKAMAWAAGKPLIGVNHIEGHVSANFIANPDLKPPFLCLIVSGGHTNLVMVEDYGKFRILGQTRDDAAGEAFDKVAKALGLGYPGGPVISKLAAQGNPKAIHFPRAMMHSGDYSFSLSGLKTAVITYIEGENRAGRAINLPDLAASFEQAVIDVQVAKAKTAVEETGVSDFCVGGGVAANPALRAAYKETFGRMGVRVTVPPMSVCGDNAAMIAVGALRSYRTQGFSPLTLDANPNAQLGSWSSDAAPVVPSGM